MYICVYISRFERREPVNLTGFSGMPPVECFVCRGNILHARNRHLQKSSWICSGIFQWMVRGMFQLHFTCQWYFRKDCHLSSGCSLDLSSGCSMVFHLCDFWCNMLPRLWSFSSRARVFPLPVGPRMRMLGYVVSQYIMSRVHTKISCCSI